MFCRTSRRTRSGCSTRSPLRRRISSASMGGRSAIDRSSHPGRVVADVDHVEFGPPRPAGGGSAAMAVLRERAPIRRRMKPATSRMRSRSPGSMPGPAIPRRGVPARAGARGSPARLRPPGRRPPARRDHRRRRSQRAAEKDRARPRHPWRRGPARVACGWPGHRRAIPGAEFRLVEGMGHEIAPGMYEELADWIAAHARRG